MVEETASLGEWEYQKKLADLVIEAAQENASIYDIGHGEYDYPPSFGSVFEMIEGSFYTTHAVGIIEHCEYQPSASLPELASTCNQTEEFGVLLAHDILTQAVRAELEQIPDTERVGDREVYVDGEADLIEVIEVE